MTYTIRDMPKQIDPALIARLAACDTATIGHFEHENFMDGGFTSVIPNARVAGTAVTISMPNIDSTLAGYVLSVARPGDFLIIDRGGERKHATWGGVVACAAKAAGVAGVVIDGPTTDFSEQREYGVPCWCRGASPITCKRTGIGGSVNVPVSVGGVAVQAGDAVLADESGIFVCRPERVQEIVEEVERRQAKEKITIAKLLAGEKLGDLNGGRKMVHEALAKQGVTPIW